MTSDIALIGLAVMGENLVLNMANNGFSVSVYNRTLSKVDDFKKGRGNSDKILGCHSIQELVSSLKPPRRIMLMVKAGDVVDSFISQLTPFLESGDIIIDGGNSHYPDTERRVNDLAKKGILFIGTGVSGGEEGALTGPSIMPGGSKDAWEAVKPIFQKIAAKVSTTTNNITTTEPCCDWVGGGGSGHFVKMVHNGIEYGDMQLICESYHILKSVLGLSAPEISLIFKEWNKGVLDSYLIEISAEILAKSDEITGVPMVDVILDAAGQKGTGKWTGNIALELGIPVTTIVEAVFARCLSSQKQQRIEASNVYGELQKLSSTLSKEDLINAVHDALYCAKITSYAQGFALMRSASLEYNWQLNYGAIALMWRGGCIIRSRFLVMIKDAFDKNKELENLLIAPFFVEELKGRHANWRLALQAALGAGIPTPATSSSLSYFDGYRTANLPANLLQAQRDYFGAHTYERIDKARGEFFHTNWTGRGGATASSTYNL